MSLRWNGLEPAWLPWTGACLQDAQASPLLFLMVCMLQARCHSSLGAVAPAYPPSFPWLVELSTSHLLGFPTILALALLPAPCPARRSTCLLPPAPPSTPDCYTKHVPTSKMQTLLGWNVAAAQRLHEPV